MTPEQTKAIDTAASAHDAGTLTDGEWYIRTIEVLTRETALYALREMHDAVMERRARKAGADATPPDWRPPVTTSEDYHAR
jgi:hypothetical protein